MRPVLFEERVKRVVKSGETAIKNVIALRPQGDLYKAMTAFSSKDIEDSGSFGRGPQKGHGYAYNREVDKMSGMDEGIKYKMSSGDA